MERPPKYAPNAVIANNCQRSIQESLICKSTNQKSTKVNMVRTTSKKANDSGLMDFVSQLPCISASQRFVTSCCILWSWSSIIFSISAFMSSFSSAEVCILSMAVPTESTKSFAPEEKIFPNIFISLSLSLYLALSLLYRV